MRKVAIPVSGNQLSKELSAATHCLLYEIGRKGEGKMVCKILSVTDAKELLAFFKEQDVDDVIVHRIEKEALQKLTSERIMVFVGIACQPPRDIIEDYRNGKLESDKDIIRQITN